MDYRSLPARTVAALVAGLRENSRLRMKSDGVKAPLSDILLATIADRMGAIMAWALGVDRPERIVLDLMDDTHKRAASRENNNVVSYQTPEEFKKARYGD